MTKGFRAGVATSRPSTADRTEIAGVMTPSPKNSAAPNRPSDINIMRPRVLRVVDRNTSASKAMMPPSPRLSARIMNTTYFSVTTMISAQEMSDSTPSTLSWLAATGWLPLNASRMAYSGLVPISPKTTPIAATVSGRTPCFSRPLPLEFIVILCSSGSADRHARADRREHGADRLRFIGPDE